MIKSMTAYGRGEHRDGNTLFTAELKSLNNRYRDIVLRIPKNFQFLEEEIRAIISSRIRRGRVEVLIQTENSGGEQPYNLELNLPLVGSYFKIFDQLKEKFGIEQEVRIETICQMRDVILFKPEEIDQEKIRLGFREVMGLALDSLDMMRKREGEAIEADLTKRLNLLEQYVNEIRKQTSNLVEEYMKRLKDNINRMLKDVAIDESRIVQEAALFAEKSDITEEIVRIRSHLNQFRRYLSLDDSLGRRLDFLIQEINREVNTLGSKTSDSSISIIVVEMKAELEKLREQIQNVE